MVHVDNIRQGELLPLIPHEIDGKVINQRAMDGYVNATAMCNSAGKKIAHYSENKATKVFLEELSADIGIPISELIQRLKGGHPENQGTWVHPHVAINLGQWVSPKFAVLVSKWVFEWMNGGGDNYSFPYHIRRYLINRNKIPPTHFSMLDQMTIKLLGALESKGYIIPPKMMPDISLGRMFSKWLRESGYDPDSFPTYEHVFDDGKRCPVQARLYPNELMTSFNLKLEEWIRDGRALEYFSGRDSKSIAPLKKVYAELPAPQK
ncbi:MAG: KilA-N domain-containing protein [Candidatus Sedimenticola sp. (ex Thyasira tokunagai)]